MEGGDSLSAASRAGARDSFTAFALVRDYCIAISRRGPAAVSVDTNSSAYVGANYKGGFCMRRMLFVLAAVFATAALAVPAALADSPHFVSAAGTLNADGSLTAKFKEAGLGTNQNIDYSLTAQGSATYVCVNNGGANPSAKNKTTVAGPVEATGTFNSGKNGNVTASLTVQPPPSDITCPSGQTLKLALVSYTDVTLTDTTNNIVVMLGDFSSGCLLPNVRGAC
jgi:hypothetical protein